MLTRCSLLLSCLLVLGFAERANAQACGYALLLSADDTSVDDIVLNLPCNQDKSLSASGASGSVATGAISVNAGSVFAEGTATTSGSGTAEMPVGASADSRASFACTISFDPPTTGSLRFDVAAGAEWSDGPSALGYVSISSDVRFDGSSAALGRFEKGLLGTEVKTNCDEPPVLPWSFIDPGFFEALCLPAYGNPGSFGGSTLVEIPFTGPRSSIEVEVQVAATANPTDASSAARSTVSLAAGMPVAIVDPGVTVTSTDCNVVDNIWLNAPGDGDPPAPVPSITSAGMALLASLLAAVGSRRLVHRRPD